MPGSRSATWERLRRLPLEVEGYSLEPLELHLRSGWVRRTTTVRLFGAGHEGRGEDVTYDGSEQQRLQARGPWLALHGEYDLDSFSERLEGLELCPDPLQQRAYADYRRWAFESAALDLALRQAGMSAAEAFGREPSPLRFVLSLGLHEVAPLKRRLDLFPGARFKLDATPDWSAELCTELAATGAVDTLDFKGAYSGTAVDTSADVELYLRALDAFGSEVVFEDPHASPEILDLLRERGALVSWDAPIHSVCDLERMPIAPRHLNIKPSRCGQVSVLCELYDECLERGLSLYGGGQFELGVGRTQIQQLAALFHSGGANDVAPRGYHVLESDEPRPASPLELPPEAPGFGVS